jgi:hypothetical protein
MMQVMKNIISSLVTPGRKITCRRCTGISKRKGEQCKKPVMRGEAVSDFNGGQRAVPKTEAGNVRIANDAD